MKAQASALDQLHWQQEIDSTSEKDEMKKKDLKVVYFVGERTQIN